MIKFFIFQNSVLVKGREEDIEWIKPFLTFKSSTSYFMRRRGGWDGSTSFFSKRTNIFPYGLWPHVKRHMILEGIKYKAYSKRTSLEPLRSRYIGDIKLFKDQVEPLNRWLKNGGTGIIWAAAGYGKTEVAAAAIKQVYKQVDRVLFVVNGLDLLEQTVDRLQKRFSKKEVRSINDERYYNAKVLVANIQSIDRAIKGKDQTFFSFLKSVDLLVYDEIHHGRSAQSGRLIRRCRSKYRLGISARPFHKYDINNLSVMKVEDARVLKVIGPVVARVRPSKLIKTGRLSKPKIFLVSADYDDDQSYEMMPYKRAKQELIIRNNIISRTTVKAVKEAAKANQTTLVIAGGSRELGNRVYMALQEKNFNVVNLHGSVKKDFRELSRQKMIKNRLEACVATTIYDEGIDIPNLRQVVLAYGGLSAIKNEQRIGRGLRTKKGQDVAVIVDFMIYSNKHLRRHSYARVKMYKEEEEYEVYLVGRNHTSYVKRLVGKENIVDSLPTSKLYKDLSRDRTQKED